jgi:exodeoxyribonuclease VII small subunit
VTYERAMQRLEEITKMLSNDAKPLSESVPLIEEAIGCHRAASEQLTAIETKVKVLCEASDGMLIMRDL